MMIRPSHCCVAHPDHRAPRARTAATDVMAARVNPESQVSRAHWVHVAWTAYRESRALRAHLVCPATRDRPARRAIAAILVHLV